MHLSKEALSFACASAAAAAGFYTKRGKVLRGRDEEFCRVVGALSARRHGRIRRGYRCKERLQKFIKILVTSSLSSVDSVLFSREVDPAELLMDLGFGGASTDRLARIPLRFFQPSKVRYFGISSFSSLLFQFFWDNVNGTFSDNLI